MHRSSETTDLGDDTPHGGQTSAIQKVSKLRMNKFVSVFVYNLRFRHRGHFESSDVQTLYILHVSFLNANNSAFLALEASNLVSRRLVAVVNYC